VGTNPVDPAYPDALDDAQRRRVGLVYDGDYAFRGKLR